jgi:hypothetical protein
MTTVSMTNPATAGTAPRTSRFLAPVPFGRLLRVQLDIWRVQRGVLGGTLVAVLAGLAGVLFAFSMQDAATSPAAAGQLFAGGSGAYTLCWLAVGIIAGASPYRSGWATLVLVIAPRRLRWLAAGGVSLILWTLGATLLFGVLSTVMAAGVLATREADPASALGVVADIGPVLAAALLRVAVGFALGAAMRNVTAPLVLGFAIAPALPLLSLGRSQVGRWTDLGAAIDAVAAGRPTWTAAAALLLWLVLPCVVAALRLRRGPVG